MEGRAEGVCSRCEFFFILTRVVVVVASHHMVCSSSGEAHESKAVGKAFR